MKKFTLVLGLLVIAGTIGLHGVHYDNNQNTPDTTTPLKNKFNPKYPPKRNHNRSNLSKKRRRERFNPFKKNQKRLKPKTKRQKIKKHIQFARDDYESDQLARDNYESKINTKKKNELNNGGYLNDGASNYSNSENSEIEREEYGSLSSDEDS